MMQYEWDKRQQDLIEQVKIHYYWAIANGYFNIHRQKVISIIKPRTRKRYDLTGMMSDRHSN